MISSRSWLFTLILLSTSLKKDNGASAAASSEVFVREPERVSEADFQNSQFSDNSIQFEVAQQGFIEARQLLREQDAFEERLIKEQVVLQNPNTAEFRHFEFLKTKPEAVFIAKVATAQEFASISIAKRLQSEQIDISDTFPKTDVSDFVKCQTPTDCFPVDDKYRRYDGGCNNLKIMLMGKTFTPFNRLTKSTYKSVESLPRVSDDSSSTLPSARLVSTQIASSMDKPSPKYTLSVMQWGQFIDHDLTQTPAAVLTSRYGETSGIECCSPDKKMVASNLHKDCFPIIIPNNDPFYGPFEIGCMNFVRSLTAPSIYCTPPIEKNQMNQISHYLDGSAVYGSSDSEASKLRAPSNGLLKIQGDNLLPDNLETSEYDFIAGDTRVNEQPQLSLIHTLWVRQHNRVANVLRNLNPQWAHEEIFQETRRIIVAQIQHIVYKEWLPIILGKTAMKKLKLVPLLSGFLKEYKITKQNKDATIFNEFAAAAFRFGHTLVQGNIELYNVNGIASSVSLSENFGNSALISSFTKFEQLLRGLFIQPMQNFDKCVADDLTNKLFKGTQLFGLDLVALNIQRGRDHGLPTYSQLVEFCSPLTSITDFVDLEEFIDTETVDKLRIVYNDIVEDVDAYIGGIAEITDEEEGILGPLFTCIVGRQFLHLKLGDRFYYENGDLSNSFKEVRLNEIRKTTWARIICDNSNIQEIQPKAFLLPDATNQKSLCSDFTKIPTVSFNSWDV